MTAVFDANYRILSVRHPAVAEALNEARANSTNVEFAMQNGQSLWRLEGKEGAIPHGSLAGFDTVVPEKKLYFLYGLGDGEFLSRLAQLPHVKYLLVFEPSAAFFKSLADAKDLHAILNDPKISFLIGSDQTRYLAQIENYLEGDALRYYASGNFGNLVTPGTEAIPGYPDIFVKFAETVPKAIQNYTNKIRSCTAEDCFRGFINAIKNLKTFPSYPGITQFKEVLSNVPGVLVGTGPSLKSSIGFLKKIQDRVAIMACDSALNILMREGIEPHFAVCLERMPWQSEIMTDLSPDMRPVLVAPNIIHPSVFANFPGRKIAIHRNVGPDEWLFPAEPRHFLGSFVSHAGLAGLLALGCREVYLLGMDSAYGPDAPDAIGRYQTYYEGASGAMIKNIDAQDVAWENTFFDMPGYDGKMRRTTYHWYTATHIFNAMIKNSRIAAKNVIPLTHGIPIPGAERVDPETFFAELDRRDSQPLWEKIDATFSHAKSQHFDAAKSLGGAKTFLAQIRQKCLNEILRISQFWFDNEPVMPRYLPNYPAFFESVEQERYRIMTHESGFFKTLLVPLILNDHALMEYNLMRAFAAEPTLQKRVTRQIELYMSWYQTVMTWSDRLAGLLEKN